MGLTLTEKIISRHLGDKHVEPGQRVSIPVDRCLLGERCFYEVIRLSEQSGSVRPNFPETLVAALDQMAGACHRGRLEYIRLIREYARRWEVERLYEWGEGGIEIVTFADGGHVRPGDVVVSGESMNRSLGALGALVLAIDTAGLYQAVIDGRVEMVVPHTVRLVFRGTPNPWVGGMDYAIHIAGLLGMEYLQGKALEIGGEAIAALDMSERMAMAAFVTNLGAHNLIIEADEKTEAFVRARCDRNFLIPYRDVDAAYDEIIEIDVNNMGPQVFIPSRPERVVRVTKCHNMEIDKVIIGTGGSGRIEDIRLATALLREHLIHHEVGIVLIPGSQQAYLHAIEEGLIQILMQSGIHIGLPSGQYSDLCHLHGMAGDRMRCLSTSGYIYPPEAIAGDNEIVYCNPAVA
ncbi:MAG: aconitase family protein, partial [Planctomycetota bacterium]